MAETQENLAEFVSRIIEEKKLSFRKVADKSNHQVSHSTVADIANGQRFDIKKDTLTALAKGLDVPADDLFRVARGLTVQAPKDRFEIYAETFDAGDLSDEEWRLLETFFAQHIRSLQAFKEAAGKMERPLVKSTFKRKEVKR